MKLYINIWLLLNTKQNKTKIFHGNQIKTSCEGERPKTVSVQKAQQKHLLTVLFTLLNSKLSCQWSRITWLQCLSYDSPAMGEMGILFSRILDSVVDEGLIPEWGRSFGGGHGNPLQYSCLEDSMGRGAWWTTVLAVAKSQTWLSLHPGLLRYFTRSLCWAGEKTRENVKFLGPTSVPPSNSFSVLQSPSQDQLFVTPWTGLPDPQHFPEFAQVHVHWIGDAIQPSHPLSACSLSAFNLFQHQRLFHWVGCLHQVAKYWNFNNSVPISSSIHSFIVSNFMVLISPLEMNLKCVLHRIARLKKNSLNSKVIHEKQNKLSLLEHNQES